MTDIMTNKTGQTGKQNNQGQHMSAGCDMSKVGHSMGTAQQNKGTILGRLLRTLRQTMAALGLLLLTGVSAWADVDLIMTDVSTPASNLPIGNSATFSAIVHNQGSTSTTVGYVVGIYLSTDATITTADTLIQNKQIYTYLAAGASKTVNFTTSIPVSVTPGTYYLGAIADTNNAQPETDETNNGFAGASMAVVADVDLIMTDVSTPASNLPIGNSATFSAIVHNQGSTSTTVGYVVGIYLSTDATITTADTLIQNKQIYTYLAAGASKTVNFTTSIPVSVTPGTYYLGAIADTNNAQPETDETNNGFAGASMAAVADVDLIMTDVSTPASNLPIGNSATFSAIVHNQGSTSTTVGYAVGIYLSTDATITTADTLIQNKQIYTYLATGASKTVNFTASIPGSVTPGTYYLGAIADTNNAQPETDETNNGFAGASMAVGNTAPTISLTSPAANATVTAPGSFIITADAQDVDNNIADVKFYQGTTLLGTVTAAPYSYTWNNIAEGSYSLTAKVTDTIGATSTSVAVSVTVDPAVVTGIQTYFIHSDHLDTPREVTSTSGTVVWQWKRTFPFGDNMANEDPNGAGQFTFNLRFPGQYFDEETLTHYNVNRDYDPAIGRYLQSDPIGLQGGINTYGYALQNPLRYIDVRGLEVIYNGNVILNQQVRSNLERLDRALSGDVIVTGGDRYRDADGNIRSASNGEIVPEASQTSPHLYENGARAADIAVPGSSNQAISDAIRNKTDYAPGNTATYDDGHTHVALPPSSSYNVPPGVRREFCRQNPAAAGCNSLPQNDCMK